MTKTDIIHKLTSRKLWLAVALFVSCLWGFCCGGIQGVRLYHAGCCCVGLSAG